MESEREGLLSNKANLLINTFETGKEYFGEEKKITVNPVVSEVASWYERLRNAMDYRADEVILRAAIERILKRRILILGQTGRSVAEPLVRELIWARYFPDGSIPEAILDRVAISIDLYLMLGDKILKKHKNRDKLNEWIYQIMSADLEQILNPNKEEDTIRNFMFQTLRENVIITDDKEQSRDAQVFIAVCRAFSKDDNAFLRSHLFRQFFGELTLESLKDISDRFMEYVEETQHQMTYPLKERIYGYIKKQTPPFLILRDIFLWYKGSLSELLGSADHLGSAVFDACEHRYSSIASKIRRAILRSVLFILLTKTIFALTVEGTYEMLFFGAIHWPSMLINMGIPPILMVVVGLFMRTPDRDNSGRILSRIETVLFDEKPKLPVPLTLRLAPDGARPFITSVFTLLWLLAFLVSFGAVYYILTILSFNIVNKAVFIFFFTIVSFLAYRISQMASEYNFDTGQALTTPIIDFFFMPVIRVGRQLTEGIAQLNLILFIFDSIIETPFKGLFAFFEQWFLFLHSKREELG